MTIKDLSKVRAQVEILQLVKTKQAELKELETSARAAVEDEMGEADLGALDDEVVVEWPHSKRRQLDQKALRDAHPEIAEEFTKLTPIRTFKVLK